MINVIIIESSKSFSAVFTVSKSESDAIIEGKSIYFSSKFSKILLVFLLTNNEGYNILRSNLSLSGLIEIKSGLRNSI